MPPTPIISVRGLGKKYRLGATLAHNTLRDHLAAAARRLLQLGTRSSELGARGAEEEARSSEPSPSVPRSAFRVPRSESPDFWALRDVSFDVQQGEVVGIIGRNGAGKSTLLKILSQITEPTEGEVRICGRVASLLEVGTGFHPELSGRENIYLNGAILGMRKKEIDARFDDIVAFAEVERFIDTPVKRYSSGMYVRLAFAVAAHLEPEILLVDEVLAVGDAAFQKKCLGKMKDVAAGGRTVLFVTHNMLAVNQLCPKALMLEGGQVAALGTTSEVVAKYVEASYCPEGEVSWDTPDTAPGDHQVRLAAVRVVSDGAVAASPFVDRDIQVQIDYWNIEEGGRRKVSVHLFNAHGELVFISANLPGASAEPDPWVDRPYPKGLFRTTCVIPGLLLNPGLHFVNAYITGGNITQIIVDCPHVISFKVCEVERFRNEYLGVWRGAVRPVLPWHTERLQ